MQFNWRVKLNLWQVCSSGLAQSSRGTAVQLAQQLLFRAQVEISIPFT